MARKSLSLVMPPDATLRARLDYVQARLQLDEATLAWYLGLHPKQLAAFKSGREDLPEAANLQLLNRTGYLKLSDLFMSALSRATREKLLVAEARHAQHLAHLEAVNNGEDV